LKSSDILVLTTRPPMDDEEAEVGKPLRPSRTLLEKKAFSAFRQYLKFLDLEAVKRGDRPAVEDLLRIRPELVRFAGEYGKTGEREVTLK
jgi:hypothetical protein